VHEEARRLIAELELRPHPEGGFYRELFRSASRVATDRGLERSALTSIYFLLPGDAFSEWHHLASDETWHFYRGSPLELTIIQPHGVLEQRSLGPDGPWQTTAAAGAYLPPTSSTATASRWSAAASHPASNSPTSTSPHAPS